MSDTWSDIQALKTKQSSLREKIAQRRKKRKEIAAGILGLTTTAGATQSESGATTSSSIQPSTVVTAAATNEPVRSKSPPRKESTKATPEFTANVEQALLLMLGEVTLSLPCDVQAVTDSLNKSMHIDIALTLVEDLLHKLAAQALISLSEKEGVAPGHSTVQVDSVDLGKLSAVSAEPDSQSSTETQSRKRTTSGGALDEPSAKKQQLKPPGRDSADDSVESLLSMQSAKEKENKKLNEEILQLLSKPTAKELSLVEKFRSQGGAQVKEFCAFGTRLECLRTNTNKHCDKLHFRKIIHKHTDESLGDCSFLNTCFHMDTCKYVHYEVEHADRRSRMPPRCDLSKPDGGAKKKIQEGSTTLFPPQWVKCDLRNFEMSVLGKFTVIMADPPWDIHMELPYGTMSDDEMRQLAVPVLQDDGYIFLWVTGRAMELGRECLTLWGYERIDELIWVKTNQLQRIIRTGRTGHWLNHGKEHCLVGMKGNPTNVNRGLDCDVIVAEVRATSHKPDEIYGIIERLAPGSRKIELFGRPHNVQPNWVTLGNQVDGVKLLDPEIVEAFKKRYPDGNCLTSS
ncbi:hypothetical protein NP493_10g04021 [Ridgeia piscesae]|uniref:mRNA m(6)A methyltransferase n=1 Tax=Ridgeia piscesae TaxID=27915 RepID=A0AAD9UL54_RIDPI|nr:hypothetical protein NP493_10g04021 [Ridgeia piscesae]